MNTLKYQMIIRFNKYPLFYGRNFPIIKTLKFPFFLLIKLITLSVNFSQPIFLCEFAIPDSTVNTLFNNKTPCLAQDSRFP